MNTKNKQLVENNKMRIKTFYSRVSVLIPAFALAAFHSVLGGVTIADAVDITMCRWDYHMNGRYLEGYASGADG